MTPAVDSDFLPSVTMVHGGREKKARDENGGACSNDLGRPVVLVEQNARSHAEPWYVFITSESRTTREEQWVFAGTIIVTAVD